MANRPSGGPAAVPVDNFKPKPGFDQNSRIAKPSTAGNKTAKVAPNMHKQPNLQMVLANRKLKGK